MRRLSARLRELRAAKSGVVAMEFALLIPLFLTIGLFGVDIAYMSLISMKTAQMAQSLADNASRLGQTDNSSVTPTITENDIESIMGGALREGLSINLATKGRLILSSFEVDPVSGKQFIHWQRCKGSLAASSKYGNDTNLNGLSGPVLTGFGSTGTKITANGGSAIMVAEIYYRYDGLFSGMFPTAKTIRREAAFVIRDDRNLTPGVTGTAANRCSA